MSGSGLAVGAVGVALVVGSLGVGAVTLVLACLSAVLVGAVCQVAWRGWERWVELREELEGLESQASLGLLGLLKRLPPAKPALSNVTTAPPNVDYAIQEIVSLVVRDFVEPWYAILTIDDTFKDSLRSSAFHISSVLSQCLADVDWERLLTSDLVDDFASHLRLYRKARARMGERSTKGGDEEATAELESLFFDLELEMEKNYCRDLVSTSPKYENAYLHDLADALMYLVAAGEDFRCRPLRFLLREVLVRRVVLPVVDQLSDPDFINQFILWLLDGVQVSPEDFLCIVDGSTDEGELSGVAGAIEEKAAALRARDTGGQDDAAVKAQLSSLSFLLKVVNSRLRRLRGQEQDQDDTATKAESAKLNLTLPFILNNNIGLSYFIDFLATVHGQDYIDLYLAIEGFKASVEHQMRRAELSRVTSGKPSDLAFDKEVVETIREAARSLFDQYLAPEAGSRIRLEPASLLKSLQARLSSDESPECWFDEVQDRLFTILETDVRFYPAFRQNPLFFRMLADLALIGRDGERVEDLEVSHCEEADGASLHSSLGSLESLARELGGGDPGMEAAITTIGIGRDGATAFALYQINVTRRADPTTHVASSWNVQRRYSDFFALNALIESRFPNLASLGFPGKKTFNNLNQEFLERRKKALNSYLRALLLPEVLRQNPGLELLLGEFVCQKDYEPEKGPLTRRVKSLVRPLRTGAGKLGQAVTAVPDTLFEGVARMGDGLGKVTKSMLGVGGSAGSETDAWLETEGEEGRVGAALGPDSIPIRILLLLMDEIFGLRQRNQWFRRRLVAFLRQLVNAALGQSINRKILELVSWLTSEDQVVEYLKTLKATVWPNGVLLNPAPPRPLQTQLRARMAAKAAMFSALPDELRLFIGSETSRSGTQLVFSALQSPALNRRLVYVFLERLLTAAFARNPVPSLLAKLHSKSPRCSNPNSAN